MHQTIKKVTEDIEELKFNTAISSLMIFVNALEKESEISESVFETLLIVLAPFAPHITEELWSQLGNKKSLFLAEWPQWNKKKIVIDTVKVPVQVNGKVRAILEVSATADEKTVRELALADEKVKFYTEGKALRKVIYVPGRILNLVVG